MSISFNEVVHNKLIDNNIINILDKRCKCGSDIVFSDSLKVLMCKNENCAYSIAVRVLEFCKYLGIQIEYEEAIYLVKKLNIRTPYQLMMLKEVYDTGMISVSDVENITTIIEQLENVKNNEYYLYQIAEMACISDIRFIEYKLFDGFESFDIAYDEIENGQVSFINERLGIKNSDSAILSLNIYNKLIDIKDELLFAETQINVRRYNKRILNIAFSDNIYPYVNKYELLRLLDYKYTQYKFCMVTIINSNTDILIKNGDGNTNKFRAAKLINDKYIADEMNSNKLTLSDIGKYKQNELKPLGSIVMISTLDNFLSRLDLLESGDINEWI